MARALGSRLLARALLLVCSLSLLSLLLLSHCGLEPAPASDDLEDGMYHKFLY